MANKKTKAKSIIYRKNVGISPKLSGMNRTRWNGNDKISEQEVLDDKEFNGSLIKQLHEAISFFRVNTRLPGIKKLMEQFTNQNIAKRPSQRPL